MLKENIEEGVRAIVDDGCPWYAIKLYSLKLEEIRSYLEGMGLECFVPMQYVDIEKKEGGVKHVLRPVMHNFIFVKQTLAEPAFKQIVVESNYKMSILRRLDDSTQLTLIPSKQMYEFRMMCNPEITLRKFISEEEAKLKPGAPVLVKYGPMKGLTGRLVRSNKKYYLLKEVPGMGVMLKISRWCCVPDEAKELYL